MRFSRLMPLGDARPKVGIEAFLAPNASVIGNVKLGDRAAGMVACPREVCVYISECLKNNALCSVVWGSSAC